MGVSTSSDHAGLALAGKEPFDPILLDVHLPGMEGYAVARALGAVPALQGTPIVAVTAFAVVGDREKALEAGCSGYIEKPIQPEPFVVQVDAFGPGPPSEPLRSSGVLVARTGQTRVDATRATAWQVEPGRYVRLCVRDEGSGIPPEVLPPFPALLHYREARKRQRPWPGHRPRPRPTAPRLD